MSLFRIHTKHTSKHQSYTYIFQTSVIVRNLKIFSFEYIIELRKQILKMVIAGLQSLVYY